MKTSGRQTNISSTMSFNVFGITISIYFWKCFPIQIAYWSIRRNICYHILYILWIGATKEKQFWMRLNENLNR